MRIQSLIAATQMGAMSSRVSSNYFRDLSPDWLMEYRNTVRNSVDAIVVGCNTIHQDNPSLLNLSKDNYRIIIHTRPDFTFHEKIFETRPEQTVIVMQSGQDGEYLNKISNLGSKYITVNDINNYTEVANTICSMGIQELLVEGGARTISGFTAHGLIDRSIVALFPASSLCKEAVLAPPVFELLINRDGAKIESRDGISIIVNDMT